MTHAQDLYWEPPKLIARENVRFPQAYTAAHSLFVFYQEVVPGQSGTGNIYIDLLSSPDGKSWDTPRRIAGPFSYEDPVPLIYGALVDSDDNLLVAISASGNVMEILRSKDEGRTFETAGTINTDAASVYPQIFERASGGYILLANQPVSAALTIIASTSPDGTSWQPFSVLERDTKRYLNFNPTHATTGARDFVAYQSVDPAASPNFQIYLKYSDDGGETWSDSKLVTNFLDPGDNPNALKPDNYDNERPHLARIDGHLAMVWERRQGRNTKQVYYVQLNEDGSVSGTPLAVSRGLQSANYPRLLSVDGKSVVTWFEDNGTSAKVLLAVRQGAFFKIRQLNAEAGSNTFPTSVVIGGRVYAFWQSKGAGGQTQLVYLQPDTFVAAADLTGENFSSGQRTSSSIARIAWTSQKDPSGIKSYSFTWSQDASAAVPETEKVSSDVHSVQEDATKDGPWYFRLRTEDFAGNWSSISTVSFIRDTTPPGAVTFVPPNVDETGYLVSNTFTVRWKAPADDDVAGYTYSLDYLAAADARPVLAAYTPPAAPPNRVVTTDTSFSDTNLDNGLWALSVAAVDTVGNVGPSKVLLLRLNKYIPVTYISSVDTSVDMLGRISLDIKGRGFTSNGDIRDVILDRDGQPPWDYDFKLGNGNYTVESDRQISGPTLDLVSAGSYRVGLVHSERGLYFTAPLLTFESSGTIKFGDFTIHYAPKFALTPHSVLSLPASRVLMYLTLALLAAAILFSSFRLAGMVREGALIRAEVYSLLTGRRARRLLAGAGGRAGASLDATGRRRIQYMKKRGAGLRLKFSFFVVVLVVSVVLMVAVVLGNFILDTQKRTLAQGLQNRVEVLLQSLATGAEQYLPNASNNILNLSQLPDQMPAIQEAQFVTITGPSATGSDAAGFNYVWATNDPRITGNVSQPAGGTATQGSAGPLPGYGNLKLTPPQFQRGQNRLADDVTPALDSLQAKIDADATQNLGDLPKQLSDLANQILQLVRQTGPTVEQQMTQVDDTRRQLEQRANQILAKIGNVVGSVPHFDPNALDPNRTHYIFYKPIVYLQPNSQVYYHGLVRLGISTDLIQQQIESATKTLIRNTVLIAMIAVGIGILGALLLATVIVIPIRRLVRGVEVIRDTEDKARLEDHFIDVRTRDELYLLADVINQMTQGLVKAAVANKDLTIGKEVQKMFIPLDRNSQGNKVTTGIADSPNAEFFGYYEGAKGVSGDYFDYQALDDEHFAVMKCDVSGKGVPAALIMVEVATIFLNHFRDWNRSQINTTLPILVGTVNDLLEQRGFKGRFAAFTVALVNIKTGVCRMCNAGDNKVHIFSREHGKMVQTLLPETPAAGVFPSMMVPGGFKEVPVTLRVGDILLLFTDGLEEAKRYIRGRDFRPYVVSQADVAAGRYAEDLLGKNVDEELGMERIYGIVDTLQRRGTYRLERTAEPAASEELEFDFSTCEQTSEHSVMALVAIEKVFRMYADPTAGPDDRVQVDRKVDGFLRKHFKQYDQYFHHPLDLEPESEYIYFTHIREDEQYDDLTILGIRKK